MSSPIRSLIVKEWHEQKWRCASLSAIGLSVMVFTIAREPVLVLGSGVTVIYFQAFLGTIFIAMGVAAGERSSDTLNLLRALPVEMRTVSTVKLTVGAATCMTPILLVLIVIALWLGAAHLLAAWGHESFIKLVKSPAGFYANIDGVAMLAGAGIASSLIIYLWVVAVGMSQRTELRAGLQGIALLIGWVLVIAITQWVIDVAYGNSYTSSSEYSYLLALVVGISPFGVYTLLAQEHPLIGLVIVTQSFTVCALIVWIVTRYGRMAIHDNTSPTERPIQHALCQMGRPRRSPITAIAWKQWRDSLPMVVVGLTIVMFFVIHAALESSFRTGGEFYIVSVDRSIAELSRTIGVMLALVVGVGTFVGDYRPAALTFWRSRPISPRLWFWSKYLTGLTIVELSMVGPWLGLRAWWGLDFYSGIGYLSSVTLLYMFIYTVAVWMACLLRHTVYAGIVAMGIVMAVIVPPLIEPALEWLSIARVEIGPDIDRLGVWFLGELLPFFLLIVLLTGVALWLATRAARGGR